MAKDGYLEEKASASFASVMSLARLPTKRRKSLAGNSRRVLSVHVLPAADRLVCFVFVLGGMGSVVAVVVVVVAAAAVVEGGCIRGGRGG